MDQHWANAANNLGIAHSIQSSSLLDSIIDPTVYEAVIISNGLHEISQVNQSNLLNYLIAGGHIYVQCEFDVALGTNQLFKHLVDETGSSFTWHGTIPNDIAPVSISSALQTDGHSTILDHFWYGTNGCGGNYIVPILSKEENHYGFTYENYDAAIGRVLTISDHDWIRRIDDTTPDRKALLERLLEELTRDISANDTAIPLTIAGDINPCTSAGLSIEGSSEIDSVQWYINDVLSHIGASLNIIGSNDGDEIYATVTTTTGCFTHTSITETITIANPAYQPAFESRIEGDGKSCNGTPVVIRGFADEDLPQLRHQWIINGSDTEFRDATLTLTDFEDGDVIGHVYSFWNGCFTETIVTDGLIVISTNEIESTGASIRIDETIQCTDTLAELQIDVDIALPQVQYQWFRDGHDLNHDERTITVEINSDPIDYHAIVRYFDQCSGWVTFSTPVQTVQLPSYDIEILEVSHTSCIQPHGVIEVASEMPNASYNWSNGDIGKVLTGITSGTYTVHVANDAGCSIEKTIDLLREESQLIKSLTVENTDCDSIPVIVNLELIDSDIDLMIQWIDENGNVVAVDELNPTLSSGQYNCVVESPNGCFEEYAFNIPENERIDLATADTIIATFNTRVTLNDRLVLPQGYEIQWTNSDDLSCDRCTSPEVTALYNKTYNYVITMEDDCTSNGHVTIVVDRPEPYYAPNAFSPDGDGINDVFEIYTRADVEPTSDLKIFDRWGNLIHQSTDNGQGWGGRSQGKKVTAGTFVYVQEFVDAEGIQYIAKGSVSLF